MSTVKSHSLLLGLVGLAFLGLAADLRAEATVTGQAVSVGPEGESFAVPGVAVQLVRADGTIVDGAAASTDELGVFRFAGVADGCYVVTGAADGFEGQSELFCVPDLVGPITVPMHIEDVVESVVVSATAIGINPVETSSQGEVGEAALDNAPKANRSFDDVLPLIPGVLRGPSGEINLNGARTSQSGARVNNADVTDPVTRQSEVNLPADVVSRIEVLSSPYDAEYGGFTGAMSRVETKSADSMKFDVAFQNFNPRLRKRDGAIMGVESATPRLTMTGPIKKGRIGFLQSTEYQFVRAEQEDAKLDPLARDTEREALSVFTQVDAQHTDKNSTTVNLLFFPEKLNFFGLDAFNPQPSTPDLRRRGTLTTVRNTHQFGGGAALLSQFDVQDLAADVRPLGFGAYTMGLEGARGSFFHRQNRNSFRRRWSELYHFAPFEAWGKHQFKTGGSLARETYRGMQTFEPVTWLGAQEQVVRRMEFAAPASLEAGKNDSAIFLQDKWQPAAGLTLDLGARVERDSIAQKANPSYRAGFAYAIGKGARTVLRGGTGLFYDRISLVVPTFLSLPDRTDTLFGPGDPQGVASTLAHRLDGRLENPRSLSWSLQLDREVMRDLFVRAGYQQRRTTRNFLIQRREDALALTNAGRDSYREWQLTTRYRVKGDNHITGSYIRSSSVGDLNDLGSIFGVLPAALVQPNERAPLAFDAPNRFLFWADIGLPWQLRAAPVVELRQGFPYSHTNELREIVGARNRAGRFPMYKTLDLQITKRFKINFRGKEKRIRLGVRMFNVLNTFNPQDVQGNLASPFQGVFYRGVKRRMRGVLEIGN